jgi:hypothetical protein
MRAGARRDGVFDEETHKHGSTIYHCKVAFERMIVNTIFDSESESERIVPEESKRGCVCLMKGKRSGKVAKARIKKYLLKLRSVLTGRRAGETDKPRLARFAKGVSTNR